MLQFEVQDHQHNKRLDQILAEELQEYSRSNLVKWLTDGLISLDGVKGCKGKLKVKSGSIINIDLNAMENKAKQLEPSNEPENIDLDIVYQDADVIIINKPENLVVHPGAGNRRGTLVNGLLYHFPELAALPRAGIVHRLDKDTTGLMVVARNLIAHTSLVRQLQERSITRKYQALVNGHMVAGSSIDLPIGRHKTNRIKMAVLDEDNPQAKEAITHYRVLKKYKKHSLLELKLETGRTHQIRVHMTYAGYPLVGDVLYGRAYAMPKELTPAEAEIWQSFKRQALCAVELGFEHPTTKEYVSWSIDLPDDMQQLLNILESK